MAEGRAIALSVNNDSRLRHASHHRASIDCLYFIVNASQKERTESPGMPMPSWKSRHARIAAADDDFRHLFPVFLRVADEEDAAGLISRRASGRPTTPISRVTRCGRLFYIAMMLPHDFCLLSRLPWRAIAGRLMNKIFVGLLGATFSFLSSPECCLALSSACCNSRHT